MTPEFQPSDIAQFLGKLLGEDQVTEVRALGVNGRRAVSRYFKSGELDDCAEYAVQLDRQQAKGIYFVVNPLRPDLHGSSSSCRDADILERRWLLIDIDPVRQADTSATKEQKDSAWEVADEIRRNLIAEGLGNPVVSDSGNGWHLYLKVRLPNDDNSKALCRELLKQLGNKFNTEKAIVDQTTYNASRICRVPGTTARKGPSPEMYRRSWLVGPIGDDKPIEWESQEQCFQTISNLLQRWKTIDDLRKGRQATGDTSTAYINAAVSKEAEKVANAKDGDRNNQLNRSAHALGTIRELDRQTAYEALYRAAKSNGLSDEEIQTTFNSGYSAGQKSPRQEQPKTTQAKAANGKTEKLVDESEIPVISPDDVCTIHDLARAGAEITWVWEGWIQRGVINVIGAEAGVGKTRCVSDLMRRIAHGLPWPDGQPMNLSKTEKSLWVLADQNHDEMVTLCRSFDIMDSIVINTIKAEPYGGTGLDDMVDLIRLESIIKAIKPIFVTVDTVGNSTDRKLHASEDMRAYYTPLQKIARRNQVAFLCLTHLNAAGGMLGRRVLEKARSVIRITKPDTTQENRRRLEVVKSNSKPPQPLGITMGDLGNEYDEDPPTNPENDKGEKITPQQRMAMDWLSSVLVRGPADLVTLRASAEKAGINVNLLYTAKRKAGIIDFKIEKFVWWRLPEGERV